MLLAYYISKTTALEHISYACEQEFYTFCFQPGFQVGQHLKVVNVKPGSRLIYRSCWYSARNQHTYKHYLGDTDRLTSGCLGQQAATLHSHLASRQVGFFNPCAYLSCVFSKVRQSLLKSIPYGE